MPPSSRVLSLLLPLVLIGLVIPAGIALYRVRSLALPISTVAATATIILPIFTGVTLRSVKFLTRQSHGDPKDTKLRFSWSAAMLIMLLTIFETVIATLALTNMARSDDLSCRLERQWGWLFSNKKADVIRRIQDRHDCCGLRSVQDRAWPFPDRSHTAEACHIAFSRQLSCFNGWRQDQQITGGLMFLVAVAAFVLKLLMLVIYRNYSSSQPSTRSAFSHFAANEDAAGTSNRRRIGTAYYDNPLLEADREAADPQSHGEADDQRAHAGPAMQPSRLHADENEWRYV